MTYEDAGDKLFQLTLDCGLNDYSHGCWVSYVLGPGEGGGKDVLAWYLCIGFNHKVYLGEDYWSACRRITEGEIW